MRICRGKGRCVCLRKYKGVFTYEGGWQVDVSGEGDCSGARARACAKVFWFLRGGGLGGGMHAVRREQV